MSSDQLPGAKVLQTTVTPWGGGYLVQLQISDRPLSEQGDPLPSGTIRLDLTVKVESGFRPLAALEYDALDMADSVLKALMRERSDAMSSARYTRR